MPCLPLCAFREATALVGSASCRRGCTVEVFFLLRRFFPLFTRRATGPGSNAMRTCLFGSPVPRRALSSGACPHYCSFHVPHLHSLAPVHPPYIPRTVPKQGCGIYLRMPYEPWEIWGFPTLRGTIIQIVVIVFTYIGVPQFRELHYHLYTTLDSMLWSIFLSI